MTEEPEAEALPCDEVADMQIDAVAGRRQVLSGARNAMQLIIRIATPPSDPSQTRPPLHVACVMDCSGSMGGEKLRFAKKAVLKLVKHLTPQDTLHFITYDTATEVIFQNGDLSEVGKEGLRGQIEAVRARGQTNLFGGLQVAADPLAAPGDGTTPAREASGRGEALRRIFLFSDGRVNVGVTDPTAIKRSVAAWAVAGITTGSFGIGADFDEPLMRGIASSGQGRYQFLGKTEDIPKLVSKSVHDLLDLYASEATLDIRGGERTIVSKVYGGHDHEDADGGQTSNGTGLMHLGDIHSDNLRVVLVELEVSPSGGLQQGTEFTAVEWVLTCQRNGCPVRLSGEVGLQTTRDRAALREEAPVVHVAFAVRRATDLEREVAEHLSCRERQKARDVKARQIALLVESLVAAEHHAGAQDLRKEVELLTVVLDRARQVATRLEDEHEDEELMARQCWQDRDDFSCASVCDLRERCNSSEGSGGDVGNLHDFNDNHSVSSGGSPLRSPRLRSGSGSPPLTPRSGRSASSGSLHQEVTADLGRRSPKKRPAAGQSGSGTIFGRISALLRSS